MTLYDDTGEDREAEIRAAEAREHARRAQIERRLPLLKGMLSTVLGDQERAGTRDKGALERYLLLADRFAPSSDWLLMMPDAYPDEGAELVPYFCRWLDLRASDRYTKFRVAEIESAAEKNLRATRDQRTREAGEARALDQKRARARGAAPPPLLGPNHVSVCAAADAVRPMPGESALARSPVARVPALGGAY